MNNNRAFVGKCHPEAGFTLIELIMVIVVLGILAATLAPKFLDVSGDAKTAMTDKMYTDIVTTLDTAYGIHRARNATASGSDEDTWITTCDDIAEYMSDTSGLTCDGTTLTFPDTRTSTLTPETVSSAASLGDLS